MKRKKNKGSTPIQQPVARVLVDLRTGAPLHPIAPIFAEDVPYSNIPPKVKVMRYLDFEKFEHLLKTSSLYFARPDCFPDQHEGRKTHSDPSVRSKSDQALDRHMRFGGGLKSESHEIHRIVNFISCWHMNNRDTIEMWKEYTKSSDSVVVFTKVGLLMECMPANVFCSGVKYQDVEVPRTELDNRSLLFFKPTDRAFENEFRMMRQPLPGEEFPSESKGRTIKIPLRSIIKKIVMHPQATPEFQQKVHSLVRQYVPTIKPEKSSLSL